MYISKICLNHIRGFQNLEINCRSNQTLILGKNGMGKTTLLRAIALGLSHYADANALLAEPVGNFIMEGEAKAEITLYFENIANLNISEHHMTATIEQVMERERIVIAPPNKLNGNSLLVCGYGAGRTSIGDNRGIYHSKDSVYTLFNYGQKLMDAELVLRRLRDYVGDSSYEAILHSLKQGIGLTDHDEILLPKGGGVKLVGPSVGKNIPLEAWADGYRLTFNWLLDLYGWAIQENALKGGHIYGIVLIDEIEQHLHPSLQTEILPHLAKILPHVQLFATTHSPLVALGASPDSLVVLRQEGDKVIKEKAVPNFEGYSAEDMLVDERLFDTPNVYSPATNQKLTDYHRLVEIPEEQRTPEQIAQLRHIARELRSQQLPEMRQPTIDPELQKLLHQHGLSNDLY